MPTQDTPPKQIFISYKRDQTTTKVAESLYKRVLVNLKAHGFAVPFFDQRSIDAGELWSEKIDQALARTTHFIALLNTDYWLSEQCQRELREAVRLYEAAGSPRLLFVMAEKIDPGALEVSADGRSASVKTPFPQIKHLGQINFLGPYDAAGRLVPLACADPVKLADQLYDLLQDIKRLD